jgi:hypothetical protein
MDTHEVIEAGAPLDLTQISLQRGTSMLHPALMAFGMNGLVLAELGGRLQ